MPISDEYRERRIKRLARLEVVAQLYRRGYSYRQISEEVKARLDMKTYSTQTVHADIQLLLKEWREQRVGDLDLALQAQLETLRAMRKEAWDAWDKSKQDYDKNRRWRHGMPAKQKGGETKDGGNMQTTHVTQQTENVVNNGDPRFLDIVLKCEAEENKLLGLYAPEKREVTGKNGRDLVSNIQVEVIDRREQVEGNEDTDDKNIH